MRYTNKVNFSVTSPEEFIKSSVSLILISPYRLADAISRNLAYMSSDDVCRVLRYSLFFNLLMLLSRVVTQIYDGGIILFAGKSPLALYIVSFILNLSLFLVYKEVLAKFYPVLIDRENIKDIDSIEDVTRDSSNIEEILTTAYNGDIQEDDGNFVDNTIDKSLEEIPVKESSEYNDDLFGKEEIISLDEEVVNYSVDRIPNRDVSTDSESDSMRRLREELQNKKNLQEKLGLLSKNKINGANSSSSNDTNKLSNNGTSSSSSVTLSDNNANIPNIKEKLISYTGKNSPEQERQSFYNSIEEIGKEVEKDNLLSIEDEYDSEMRESKLPLSLEDEAMSILESQISQCSNPAEYAEEMRNMDIAESEDIFGISSFVNFEEDF